MCVSLEENNLILYVCGPNEILLKGVKIVGIDKTENLMEKEDFKKKIAKMSLKTNGTRRECMVSLKCLKK